MGGDIQPLLIQLMGIATVAIFVGVSTLIIWSILQYAFGLRVSLQAESIGLDLSEHSLEAYPDFSRRALLPDTFFPSIERDLMQSAAPKAER